MFQLGRNLHQNVSQKFTKNCQHQYFQDYV